jgi:threonyl-tRNA synthetase
MLTLKLPDGSTKQVPEGTRPREIAESIGKRLAQAAVAAKVNGAIVDLDRELSDGNGELKKIPKRWTFCATRAPM